MKTHADKLFSSFYWEIELDPTNPLNKGAITLHGYSKEQNRAENRDKTQLLCNIILRINKAGYFNRFKEWRIYKRVGEFINKDVDNLFLIMYADTYKIADCKSNEPKTREQYQRIIKFLSDFYDARAGKEVKNLLPQRENVFNFSTEELLDPRRVKFQSLKDLYAYCSKLISNGVAFGRVDHFKAQVMQINPHFRQTAL
jgi:hypothetical protein